MKRTAAIIGPTPAFIRWAINMPCGLREIDTANLPATTFRQLRAIKELDLAQRDQRIFRDVAFHDDTRRGEDLVGFLPAEILAASGGAKVIENACLDCQANINREVQGWAGCFGIARLKSPSWIAQFDAIVKRLELADGFGRQFDSTIPFWFGVWSRRTLNLPQLALLTRVLAELDWGDEWSDFEKTLHACVREKLELHVEYFTAGNSDGLHWRLNAHCQNCRYELAVSEKKCPCCGRARGAQALKKRKVLGLRPYMQLKYVLGEQQCEQLVEDYLDWKAQSDS